VAFDLLTIGEALVEIMRTGTDQPLHQPGPFTGPFPSGAPFIFAVQAARLGMRVGAIGSVGQDAFAQCLLDQLAADGIDRSGVRQLKAQATGAAFIAYHADGSRSFVFSLGAGGDIVPEMLDENQFNDLRCLYLTGSTLSLNDSALETGRCALELAQQQGAKFAFDPNIRPELLSVDAAREAFRVFIEAADVLLPTAEELLQLTGRDELDAAVDVLMRQKPERLVVVKRGAAGCTVFHADDKFTISGFRVDEVDPTGAGDCFDAGFLTAWLRDESLTGAARLANACGALAVTKHGPMAGAMDGTTVRAFMEAQA